MKNISRIMLAALLLIILPAWAQEPETQQLVVPLSKPGERGKLIINLMNGGIEVTGYSGKDVIIDAREITQEEMKKIAVPWTSGEAALDQYFDLRSDLQEPAEAPVPDFYDLSNSFPDKKDNINRNTEGMKKIGGSTFHLTAEEKNNNVEIFSDSWMQGLKLNIKVPKNFNLQLNTSMGGDVNIENIDGYLEIENANGSIEAKGISGSAVLNSFNGSIKIDFDKVDPQKTMSFSTLNGDIEVKFPSSTKATMKMKTDAGEIFTDFDMKVLQNNPKIDKENRGGTYKVSITKWIYGELNGGGQEYTFQSMNGSFFIRKK
jgi:hypothetical protein